MCSCNDSGNFVIQKTLWCDSLSRQNISTLEIHCQLMLVFGNGVLRPHHWQRGCREFKSGLASIMKITPLNPADQGRVNTVQVVELVLENHQDTIQDLPIVLEWFVKTVPNIVHVWLGYSSVCLRGGYPETWWKFTIIYVCRCCFTSSVI